MHEAVLHTSLADQRLACEIYMPHLILTLTLCRLESQDVLAGLVGGDE